MSETMDIGTEMCRRIEGYWSDLRELLGTVDSGEIAWAAQAVLVAWREGKRVLLMGNGGSGATVSHIAADLQKCLQLDTGRPIKAFCLSDGTPLLSAWANDTAWHNVFAPQVTCWAEPGDVVMGVSGSGNSRNVIEGIHAADRAGAQTFGLAGFDGGLLKSAAQRCIVVPSSSMQLVEDVHMALLHALFRSVLDQAVAETKAADGRTFRSI